MIDSSSRASLSRRNFLGSSAAFGGIQFLPSRLWSEPTLEKPRLAFIGAGGRGSANIRSNDPSLARSNFEVAAPLTELMLLGCIAAQHGDGTQLSWNPDSLTTGIEAVDRPVHHDYREGWTL